ncbi:MAG TPA: vanadium-dependent haloperoxidase, partial [Candidatus Limnocylindria bacterium]|nr:vanadium-dependent haloperoxidase [Candidatus Limnocylindria bacterium]
ASRARIRLGLAALVTAVIVSGAALGAMRPWEMAPLPACPQSAQQPEQSVARRWDEAMLDAIRRALPNPPVHARNLFHVSVAMWDAWAAYDATASGYIFKEKLHVDRCDVAAARNEAISYAAYRVLTARFIKAVGADVSLSEFASLMDELTYPTAMTETAGDAPAAVGNRIAKAVLEYGSADGSNEANGYAAPDYKAVNPPLVVVLPEISMVDPNRWQPLQIELLVTQNGQVLPSGIQTAVAPHWGHVTSFGIPEGGASGVPFDPGPPPRLGDPSTDGLFKSQAVEVIRDSGLLDVATDDFIDISPGVIGANALGANNGRGRITNPVTGRPYAPQNVRAGDFYRAIAEFWADGPKSETPPGHWNVIANSVSDALAPDLRIGGSGAVVDRLQWDVKLYLALNGAVHDAAIAAWGLKGRYDGARPISMIRYMASRGQSSDPSLPAYDKDGLPLVAGLIELVTKEKIQGGSMPGMVGNEGKIAVRAWRQGIENPMAPHVAWILGTTWMPYQLPTFVTPSFQGYVSGHSTFSRAAAEVLTSITGSEYFPGGLSERTITAGTFRIENGPSADIVLQWATYYDAADQAGQSRLFGGIHVQADDFTGRILGSTCGKDAWALAQRYYAGR